MQKQFSCPNYLAAYYPNIPVSDAYTVTGDKDWVIDQGIDHLVHEHEFSDTPELRQQVSDSLTDYNPGS